METKPSESPLDEQAICVKCGLCCDGTLFSTATLLPGERGHLPSLMEERYQKIGDDETFLMPCPYFEGKCSIYNQKKAHVCSAYRCQLLKDFSKVKISAANASQIVANAIAFRNKILKEYSLYTGIEGLDFRQIKSDIYKRLKKDKDILEKDTAFKKLLAYCELLDAQLLRYFKSRKDYEKMINE